MNKVLEQLIKDLGGKNKAFNSMSIDGLKSEIKIRIDSYIKDKATASEKGLAIKFLKKINSLNDKNEILLYVSETMFNLSGMNA